MKIVVIGGTGLIGSQVVQNLRARGTRVLREARAESAQGGGQCRRRASRRLTIVGADRVPDSGYMRAKLAQEALIESSGWPYPIVRSTQFFEFMRATADAATDGDIVRVPATDLQPIAA